MATIDRTRADRFYGVCPSWLWHPGSYESRRYCEIIVEEVIPRLNFDLREFFTSTSLPNQESTT